MKIPGSISSYLRGNVHYGGYEKMNILFVIIAVVAIVLAITGGLVQSVNFLLWVGIVLLILAVIAFLIRSISGRRV